MMLSTPPLEMPWQRLSIPIINQYRFERTRQRLDAAILKAARVVLADYQPLELTPTRWVWKLANFYYLTHFTPQFMSVAAQRFAAQQRSQLAAWADQKSHEEDQHDQLALLDIQSLGYDPEAVIETFRESPSARMIEYFRETVYAADPIECVGYCYALERIAISVQAEHIQGIANSLPLGVNATRCLRVHSAIGADTDHVQETVSMIAGLNEYDRHRIAQACEKTAFLHFQTTKEHALADIDLQMQLKELSH